MNIFQNTLEILHRRAQHMNLKGVNFIDQFWPKFTDKTKLFQKVK
jgi:hypothetical protein